ncbi:hypothetical protein FZEAL_6136 [Fusarium zealandicum]|uniref:Uncharacterized protein n=1 Tax=Fusarium zealandicum TaxID=1053134 RepID=A0A8H4XJ59_9HYPO|nr:hypothetical protein FZEAL_6136 [Fusarium zealandicum]
MDPFNKLPVELRVQVLIHTYSRHSMLQVAQASPAMLGGYSSSRTYLTRMLVETNLDHGMMKDAMAIVLFPPWDESDTYRSMVESHLHVWAAQKMPNPIEKQNLRVIDQLDRLRSRLLLFIGDYLTKAMAVFPPREYLCLPTLSSTQAHTTFKDQIVSARFDTANLTDAEKKRLLRAFLRYELLSKILNPQNQGIVHLDWDALYKYSGQWYHPSEQEALKCVEQYLASLYGAMLAQCGDSWLPETPSSNILSPSCVTSTELLYPDTLYFNAEAYASDLGLRILANDLHFGGPIGGSVSNSITLAYLGFGLATTLVRSAISGKDGRDYLKQWFIDWYRSREERLLYYNSPLIGLVLPPELDQKEHCQEGPGMYQELSRRTSNPSSWEQEAIYRQRAWAFFDDARCYPSLSTPSHFPTLQELKMQSDAMQAAPYSSKWAHARALRRSQKWHDEQLGRFFVDQQDEEPQRLTLEMFFQPLLPWDIHERHFGELAPFWQ